MEISIGKYKIKSDPQCMWIEETYTGKNKKGEEKQYTRRVSGYVRTFEQLFESFMEHKVRASKAREVTELLEEFSNAEKDIKKMIKEAVKND